MAKRYDIENPERRAEAVTIKEAMESLIKAYQLQGKYDETKILASWEKVMGKTIAQHTTNIFIKQGKLFVKIDSSTLRHELSMNKSKMIDLLNEDAEQEVVKEIVLL